MNRGVNGAAQVGCQDYLRLDRDWCEALDKVTASLVPLEMCQQGYPALIKDSNLISIIDGILQSLQTEVNCV